MCPRHEKWSSATENDISARLNHFGKPLGRRRGEASRENQEDEEEGRLWPECVSQWHKIATARNDGTSDSVIRKGGRGKATCPHWALAQKICPLSCSPPRQCSSNTVWFADWNGRYGSVKMRLNEGLHYSSVGWRISNWLTSHWPLKLFDCLTSQNILDQSKIFGEKHPTLPFS